MGVLLILLGPLLCLHIRILPKFGGRPLHLFLDLLVPRLLLCCLLFLLLIVIMQHMLDILIVEVVLPAAPAGCSRPLPPPPVLAGRPAIVI